MRSDLIYILSFLPGFTSDGLQNLSTEQLQDLYLEYQDVIEEL